MLKQSDKFIYIDSIEFLLKFKEADFIETDFEDDKIRNFLKSFNGSFIRWQNSFSSSYFEFYAIR